MNKNKMAQIHDAWILNFLPLNSGISLLGSIGLDCLNLGITSSNKSTSSTPSMADNGKNQGEDGSSKLLWYFFLSSLSFPIPKVGWWKFWLISFITRWKTTRQVQYDLIELYTWILRWTTYWICFLLWLKSLWAIG